MLRRRQTSRKVCSLFFYINKSISILKLAIHFFQLGIKYAYPLIAFMFLFVFTMYNWHRLMSSVDWKSLVSVIVYMYMIY